MNLQLLMQACQTIYQTQTVPPHLVSACIACVEQKTYGSPSPSFRRPTSSLLDPMESC
jgi:hypothetical protein